jgi:hypothetical protein
MPNTFQLISSVTLSSPSSSIDFTSIPSTYTDLCLEFSMRTTNSSSSRQEDAIVVALNNDTTGGNYTVRYLRGNGSSAGSATAVGYAGVYAAEVNGSASTASTFTSGMIYFPNYAGSTNKSFSIDVTQEANQTTAYAQLHACLWSNTTAINRISFSNYNSNTFATYTNCYLYGVKNA